MYYYDRCADSWARWGKEKSTRKYLEESESLKGIMQVIAVGAEEAKSGMGTVWNEKKEE